jgi:hypothetical protein
VPVGSSEGAARVTSSRRVAGRFEHDLVRSGWAFARCAVGVRRRPGHDRSASARADFRRDNSLGGAVILAAAALPSIAVWAWRHRLVRGLVPVVGWIAAVGCCMHALTLLILRVLSLTGVHPIHYPVWLSLDRRRADLQDL